MVMHTLAWIFFKVSFFFSIKLSSHLIVTLQIFQFPFNLEQWKHLHGKKNSWSKKSYWIVLLNNQEMPRKTTCGDTVLVMPCILLPHAPNFCHCSRKVAKDNWKGAPEKYPAAKVFERHIYGVLRVVKTYTEYWKEKTGVCMKTGNKSKFLHIVVQSSAVYLV